VTRRFTFRHEAEVDIAGTYDWYEAKQAGLGTAFLEDLDAALSRILSRPFSYQIKYKSARRTALHRFPYQITYVVREEDIVIVACMHGHRDPRTWQTRL
jgi:plasmid stabilization system protein ParE